MGMCNCVRLGAAVQQRLFWVVLGISVISSTFLMVKEYTYAREVHKLAPILAELVPSSCVPSPHNDNIYIHIECPVRNSATFYPPSNFTKNISSFHGVFFEIKAEMYQITKSYKLLPGFYTAQWLDHLVPDNAGSIYDGYRNPSFFPQIPGVGRQLASSLKAGGFNLPGSFSDHFRTKHQLPLQEDGAFASNITRPPRRIDSETTLVYDNYLYTGNPLKPQVGDIRISFWGSSSSHISLIGKQIKKTFGSERTILDAPLDAPSGEPMTILAEGDYGPQSLIEYRLTQLGFPVAFVWTWRVVGYLSLFIFFMFWTSLSAGINEDSTLPVWGRMLVALLLALSVVFLECSIGWWSVETRAFRRLLFVSVFCGIIGMILRLGIFWCLKKPQSTRLPCTPTDAKYYDIGSEGRVTETQSCVGVPFNERQNSLVSSNHHKTGHIIRWTTTPEVSLQVSPQVSEEDTLKNTQQPTTRRSPTCIRPVHHLLSDISYVSSHSCENKTGSLHTLNIHKSPSLASL